MINDKDMLKIWEFEDIMWREYFHEKRHFSSWYSSQDNREYTVPPNIVMEYRYGLKITASSTCSVVDFDKFVAFKMAYL